MPSNYFKNLEIIDDKKTCVLKYTRGNKNKLKLNEEVVADLKEASIIYKKMNSTCLCH